LREDDGELVVGKNTVIRKAMEIRMTPPREGDEDYEWRKNLYE